MEKGRTAGLALQGPVDIALALDAAQTSLRRTFLCWDAQLISHKYSQFSRSRCGQDCVVPADSWVLRVGLELVFSG